MTAPSSGRLPRDMPLGDGQERHLVLVAGMHRSGTSALTRVLNLCGAALPPGELWPPNDENPDGYWESKSIVQVHDDILTSVGMTWDSTREFPRGWFDGEAAGRFKVQLAELLRPSLLDNRVLVIKDPRLCRLVPLWRGVAGLLGVAVSAVIPLRHPLEVGASLEQRNQMPRAQAMLLWLRHVIDAERDTRGLPRCFMTYEELLADGPGIARALTRILPIDPSGHEKAIADFVNRDRRHHRARLETLADPDTVSGWVATAYDWGRRAASGDLPPDAAMDAIHDGLHAAELLFRSSLDEDARWLAAATARADTIEQELREAHGHLATATMEVARHGTAAEAAREAAKAAETARDEAVQHTADAQRAHAEAEAAWHETSQKLTAESAARDVAERSLAEALHAYASEAEARERVAVQLADAQRRLAIVIATTATVRADIARVRGEASQAIDGLRAEMQRQVAHETTARLASETALREAKRSIAAEADARRQIENRIYTLTQDLMRARNQTATLAWEKQVILGSALWRVMQPLRAFGRRLPFALRLRLRRAIGASETKDFAMPAVGAAPLVMPRRQGADVTPGTAAVLAPGLTGLGGAGLGGAGLGAARLDTAGPDVAGLSVAGLGAIAVDQDFLAPRSLRIVFISGEPENPGHVYRVQRYVEAAQALGAEAMWIPLRDVVPHGEDIARASVMVIWRAAYGPEAEHALWVARGHGVKVVFDVDDLMFDPALATRKAIDGIRSQDLAESDVANHFQRVREVVMQADACTTTTDELARHLRSMDRITFVLPNLFDLTTWRTARLAVRQRAPVTDGLLRIGYAAGTRTHQRDFRHAATAVARVLREQPRCRLVLFRDPETGRPLFDPAEYPALAQRAAQIEWRDRVPLNELPNELARFDINLAPLEVGNAFCEAKSELKYFEAALVEVCTIASPTGPLRRAIRDGVTGRLADTAEEWYRALCELVDDPSARQRMAHAAYHDALARFGPQEGPAGLYSVLQQLAGVEEAARAFEHDFHRRRTNAPPTFDIPRATVEFRADQFGQADVTVIIPLYNYAHFVEEALDSVRDQTIPRIDLVVVDDASTDSSLQVAVAWARKHANRFNRILVLRNETNSGLARSRNTGFDAAETPYVLPLDADNRLRPDCCATLLDALRESRAGFAYSILQCFGAAEHVIGTEPFAPMRFASSNYIDAMALVAKWSWAKVGGYTHIDHGWEDYDFWCKCVEHGVWGQHVREILAEYRVHEASMLRTATDRPDNKRKVIRQLEDRHDWLTIDYRP